MNFSMWNLKEWFEGCGIDLSYQINSNKPTFSLLHMSMQSEEPMPGCIDVLPGDALSDCSGFNTVMIQGSDRLLFPIASPMEVINQGNRMIRHFTDWENELEQGILDGWSLPDVFRCIQKEFPFPFALFLPNGAPYRQTDDYHLQFSEKNRMTVLNAARRDAAMQPVCRTFLFDSSHSFLLATLRSKGDPVAYLIAYDNGKRFQPGHITLSHSIVETLLTYLRFHSEASLTSHALSNWFRRSIQADPQTMLRLPRQLETLKWKEDDYFQVFAVGMKTDQASNALSDLYLTLAGSRCCAIVDNILLVLHHYDGTHFLSEKDEALTALSIDTLCAGVSLPFSGLLRIRHFINQALNALEQSQNSTNNLVWTEELLSDCLLEGCRNLQDVQSLVHPDILNLAKTDRITNDSLAQTLYNYYIQGQSMARTSKALFIHRNTLRNRLDKIQEIVSMNIQDPSVQKRYLLSLILLSE